MKEIYSEIEIFSLACGKVLMCLGAMGIIVSVLFDKLARGWEDR